MGSGLSGLGSCVAGNVVDESKGREEEWRVEDESVLAGERNSDGVNNLGEPTANGMYERECAREREREREREYVCACKRERVRERENIIFSAKN